MYLINRAALVLSIKKPFLEWANSMEKGMPPLSLESLNRENHVYLLPEHDTDKELELIIQELYKEIFELELISFCREKSQWPKITYQKFLNWFDVKVNSMVFDPYEEEIEKEEFWGG